MAAAPALQDDILAKAAVPTATFQGTEKEAPLVAENSSTSDAFDSSETPTEEELHTLRRVSGKINWSIYTIAFAELCERFSYYGSYVLYANFVRNARPPGSRTGALVPGVDEDEYLPGALGMGMKASQAISLVNQFWAYLMPLFGAWLADAKYGRYKVIHIAIGVGMLAHVLLTIGAAPAVLDAGEAAFAPFFLGLFTLCCGTGLFKANISPLLAEQNQDIHMRVEVRKGKRVIVDPAVTNSRIFLYFYFAINIGAVVGQVSMVFVEKYHSFWLAFFLPTILFLFAPLVLYTNRKHYHLTPPPGRKSPSVFKINWDTAKPSNVPVDQRPTWMIYDDAWVDEVRRGLLACKVFLFLPIFFLAYNQMSNNLTAQAGSMRLDGAPNDVIQNLNPLSIIIIIPLLDHGLYPLFRKVGFNFTPIRRMTTGFFFAMFAMIAAAVMQHVIYTRHPCGQYATDCGGAIDLNVWAQSLPYVLVGLAEIFTNVTSMEYAFSKAPENMKSLVMSVNLFMSAISAALGQAFVPMTTDPLLVWNYVTTAAISLVGGIAFWFCFRHLDAEEDHLNALKKTEFVGDVQPNAATSDNKTVAP
ncbi:POT family-domain-containing protein [Apiospora rasikravindrae]|uniref:POT family-domain-containing protein n=1 Tax=Apiospora rasikravindrae TaxID=990691 RepID=A0ABR1SM82_9PEZI